MAPGPQQQFKLSLDTRVPLEAVVLQRLYRLPKGRQTEWLRQLLLVGFRSECQTLNVEVGTAAYAMRPSLRGGQTTVVPSPMPSRSRDTALLPPGSFPKQFSHLQQVIGEIGRPLCNQD